ARQVSEVFVVIGKEMWRRGILIVGLLAAAAVFYVMSQVEQPARPSAGRLVFSNQFMPDEDWGEDNAPESGGSEPVGDDSKKQGDVVAVTALATSNSITETSEVDGAPPAIGRNAAFDSYRVTRAQNRSREMEVLESL